MDIIEQAQMTGQTARRMDDHYTDAEIIDTYEHAAPGSLLRNAAKLVMLKRRIRARHARPAHAAQGMVSSYELGF